MPGAPREQRVGDRLRSAFGRNLRPSWIIRDVELLLLARVSMAGCRALTSVIVPIYLAKIGFSGFMLGALFAATAVISAILTSGIGILSDRVGRKVFIVGVPLITAGAALVFLFTRSIPVIFVFSMIGTFGRGSGATGGSIGPYVPAEQAYITRRTESSHRNAVFSRLAFASSVGAIFGNIFGIIPAVSSSAGLGGLNAYLPAFVVISLLAGVAGMLAIPIANPSSERRAVTKERRGSNPFNLSRESWSMVIKLWIANVPNGVAIGFIGPFLTYWFYKRYDVGPGTIGVLYTVINIATLGAILCAAPVARRIGLVRTVVIGRTLQGLLLIPMVLSPTFTIAGVFYLVRMCFQRLSLPLRQSFIMAMVRDDERGTVGGVANLPNQGVSAISPTIAGYIFDSVSLSLPFIIGGLFQVANSVLFWIFFRSLRPPEEATVVPEAPLDATAVAETTEHPEPEPLPSEPATAGGRRRDGEDHPRSEAADEG